VLVILAAVLDGGVDAIDFVFCTGLGAALVGVVTATIVEN
jgi:hypothetical protein